MPLWCNPETVPGAAAQVVPVVPVVRVVPAVRVAAAAARIESGSICNHKYKQTDRSDRSACVFGEGMLSDGK